VERTTFSWTAKGGPRVTLGVWSKKRTLAPGRTPETGVRLPVTGRGNIQSGDCRRAKNRKQYTRSMAAVPNSPLVPVDEYLNSSYSPDMEFVDGILVGA